MPPLVRLAHVLSPETAHRLAINALAHGFGRAPEVETACMQNARLPTRIAGLPIASPIGLAAGFDKDAEAPDAALDLGFGFVEIGTVTPRPQSGNPKPRVFRLAADQALVNRLGFNNQGHAAAAERLAARKPRRGRALGVNLGANADSADRIADYVAGLERFWALADYFTINVSSPNTADLRALQTGDALDALLTRLGRARARLSAAGVGRPVFLKIAPDLTSDGIAAIVEAAVAHGLDGLVVSNTTIARPEGLTAPTRGEAGGLSGRPLFAASTEALRTAARAARGRLTLIGVGGVEDGATAYAKIRAGAHAVQLYTALVYRGPNVAAQIARELCALLERDGFARVADAIGADL